MLMSPVQVCIKFVDFRRTVKSLQLLYPWQQDKLCFRWWLAVWGQDYKAAFIEQPYFVAAYHRVKSDARHIRNRNKRWDQPSPHIPRINPTPMPCDTIEEEEVVRSTTGDANLLRGLRLAAVWIKILR